jgi:hypothetical protein
MRAQALADAPALAGWSQNLAVPPAQRLAASKQALDVYIDQQDDLRELLSYCENEAADPHVLSGHLAYADVAAKLRGLLDGE